VRYSMKALLTSGILLTMVALIPEVRAADTAAPAAASPEGLEEIVVTAERRAEDPQKMSVSVIALSAEDLQTHGIQNVQNLQFLTPSLSYVDEGNVKFINIRGVGLNEGAPNQTDGVASHIDGSYVAQVFTVDDAYFDLSSVEVLRGPQGTYEGQNAEGGAIFINTKAPSFSGLDGFAEAKFGSYQEREFGAAVNLPLSDNLAFRLSGQNETRNSYTDNLGPFGGAAAAPLDTNQPGNLNRVLGRAQVLYEPTEGLDIRLIYQYSDRTTDGFPYILNTPQGLANPRTISYDFPEAYNVKYERTTGIVDWKINDDVKVHVVTGYQETDQYIAQDTDMTSPYVSPSTPQSTNTIQIHDWYSTNEVDLISTSSSPFQWTTGVTELSYHQPFTLQSTTYNPPGLTFDPNSGLVLDFHTFRKNEAAFGEVSYKFSPQWDIKVGGRYNYDHTGVEGGSFLIPPLPAPLGGPLGVVHVPVGPNEPSYTAGTGRVVVDFQPTPENLIYATLSRGYKPGGWTPNIGGPPTPTNVYKAEYVLNTELGWKATMLDSHLRTALDVFHMEFQNYQATVATDPNNPATSVTTNVHGTTIKGLEAQAQALMGPVTFEGGFSYLDAKYGELGIFETPGIIGPNNPSAPLMINLNGRQVDYAPKISGNVSASYTVDVGQGTLVPRLDWSYQARQWTSFFEAPWQQIPSRELLDFRVAYKPKPAWRFEGYVTNLTNKIYAAGINGDSAYPYIGAYYLGPPRLYGVSANYTF
jgi:iron complex outermembrane receptor protein